METLGSILMVNFHLNLIIFPKNSSQNPIVYWTFNELNGSVVRDDSGIENHGSFYDESNLTTPDLFDHPRQKDGIAVRFDGNQTINSNRMYLHTISGPFTYVFGLTEDLNADILEPKICN